MLYIFDGKIYVKPFENKVVEVKVSKKGNEYDVKATGTPVELKPQEMQKLSSISLEEAFKIQGKQETRTLENRTIMEK